jgi:hypothetical protein
VENEVSLLLCFCDLRTVPYAAFATLKEAFLTTEILARLGRYAA